MILANPSRRWLSTTLASSSSLLRRNAAVRAAAQACCLSLPERPLSPPTKDFFFLSTTTTTTRSTRSASTSTSTTLAPEPAAVSSLNDDNMQQHHMSHEQPPQHWETMFGGKIPVLQKDPPPLLDAEPHPHGHAHAQETATAAAAVITEEDSDTAQPASSESSSLSSSLSSNTKSTDWNISYGDAPRTSVLMELKDTGVGVLHDTLKFFWKFDCNIVRIESRPRSLDGSFDFFVDLEGSATDDNVRQLLLALQSRTDKLLILDEKKVHWFPRHASELDKITDRVLDGGAGGDLEADHPGFSDPVYRRRRTELARAAREYVWDQPIRRVEYTAAETGVWSAVWDRTEPLWERHACREYRGALHQLQEHCGYARDRIPQQRDLSAYLHQTTGFRLRPVAGLLSSRDFLNALAFRVFCATQYIRHGSRPLYTPEPDICHELLGHAPMLVDRDFADFSQEIGLASLGASDEDVDKLAHCYWHSVEFGLCRENGENKAYGAGLLSSFGELEYACGDAGDENGNRPTILPWDPEVASRQEFPITTYQPVYFLAESLQDAKLKMRRFCEDLPRPFFALHNPQTDSVFIDRPVKRTKGLPTASA